MAHMGLYRSIQGLYENGKENGNYHLAGFRFLG